MRTTAEDFIKSVYGEHWEKIKQYFTPNFWLSTKDVHWSDLGYEERDIEYLKRRDGITTNYFWRLLVAKGIEHNNHWTVINSEDDLPNKSGYYFFFISDKIYTFTSYSATDKDKSLIKHATHYKEVVTPKPPLYGLEIK